jgi:hypothetical protein
MTTNPKPVLGKRASVFREVYPIHEPHVFAAIVTDPKTHQMRYELIEPTLLPEEEGQLKEVKTLLVEEIDVNLKEIGTHEKAEDYLKAKILEIIKDYRLKIDEDPSTNSCTMLCGLFGLRKNRRMMKDPLIEDISAMV